jgi:hypothetical protein
MRLEIDALAWDRGLKVASRDGRYAPALTRLEPQRAGPGSAHTSKVKPPDKAIRSPGPLHKTPRPAAEPYAVPLRSTAPGSAAEPPAERGQYCTPIGGALPQQECYRSLIAMTGLALPNRIGGAHGEEDQHGCTTRGAGGGG